MRIRSTYSDGKTFENDLRQVIASHVDGSDYERGELEALRATIDNQSRLISRIVEKLNLSNEELNDWFSSWGENMEKVGE